MTESKKHGRSFEEDNFSRGKRIKLDSLFGELKLEDETSRPHSFLGAKRDSNGRFSHDRLGEDFKINPQVGNYSVYKKSSTPTSPTAIHSNSNLNSYIVEKLVSHFNQATNAKFQVIRKYNPRALVAYRFERWCLKMFNRFIRKYNAKNGVKVSFVRSYERMLQLIHENNVTPAELLNIILQENQVEMKRLESKKQNRAEEAFQGYNYWDTIRLERDVDMDDYPTVPRLVEVSDSESESDSDMELDGEYSNYHRPLESNYGSYYTDPLGSI